MSNPSTTYRDIEIAYDEGSDTWKYTLNGRDRSAQTLTNAKAVIDKPAPEEKKPFNRQKVWFGTDSGGRGFEVAEVTGVAEQTAYSRESQYWIVRNKQRSKEYAYYLFAKSAKNDAIVAQIALKAKEIGALQKEKSALAEQLEKFTEESSDLGAKREGK